MAYLLSIPDLIACKDVRLCNASSCPWISPPNFYTLLSIERAPFGEGIERKNHCLSRLPGVQRRRRTHPWANLPRQSPNESRPLNMRAGPVLTPLVLDVPSRSLPTMPCWHKACFVVNAIGAYQCLTNFMRRLNNGFHYTSTRH